MTHVLTDLLATWQHWSMRDTFRTSRDKAQAKGDEAGVKTMQGGMDEIPQVSALEALAANAELCSLLSGWRWMAMRDARENGATWEEIGAALKVTRQAAQAAYLKVIEGQEEHCSQRFIAEDAKAARALLGHQSPKRPTTYRPVDSGELAEGMTIKEHGRLYTITGWAGRVKGGRQALVSNSKGEPDGQLTIFGGSAYQVRDEAS